MESSTTGIASDRLLGHLRALVGERHHRSSPEALLRAEAYLSEQFRGLGLTLGYHTVEAFGGRHRNVVASLRPNIPVAQGDQSPVIVAAHYDTVAGSPGANDNASGLAVLLEAARALRECPCPREVRFIAFCLEEEQLLGSRGYAAHLRECGQALRGVIVLECVGYASREPGSQRVPSGVPIAVPSVGDFLGIVGNAASSSLLSTFEQAANQAVPELKTVALLVPGNGEMLRDTRRSDHAAFWDAGYPALMLTDTAEFRSPHYHRPTDQLDTLDLDFLALVARALAAAVSALAE